MIRDGGLKSFETWSFEQGKRLETIETDLALKDMITFPQLNETVFLGDVPSENATTAHSEMVIYVTNDNKREVFSRNNLAREG